MYLFIIDEKIFNWFNKVLDFIFEYYYMGILFEEVVVYVKVMLMYFFKFFKKVIGYWFIEFINSL